MRKAGTAIFIFLMLVSSATALVGLLAGAGAVGAIAGGLGVCSISAGDCLEISDNDSIMGSTADELQNNIYGDSLFRQDRRERAVKQVEDFSNQSYGVSMGQAKAVATETLNNDSSKSVAYERSQSQINDFYAQYQRALLEERNTEALQFNKSLTEIDNSDNLARTDVFTLQYTEGSFNSYSSVSDAEVVKENFTLVNGTSMDIYNIVIRDVGCSYTDWTDQDFKLYKTIGENISGDGCKPKSVIATDTDGDNTVSVNNNDYSDAWNAINSNRQRAIDNVNRIIDEVYNKYAPGELTLSDTLTPIEMLQTASTSYSDTGYYSYAAVSLEYMGLSSNESYAFEVEWNNTDQPAQSAHGQLFIDEEDFSNSTIEVNKTYDASDRKAYFVYDQENGESNTVELDNTFTVLSMTDTETGESVNETSVQETDIATESTEELQRQFDELQEDYEELQSTGLVGGAIGGTIGDITNWVNKLLPNMPELNNSVVGLVLVIITVVVIRLG